MTDAKINDFTARDLTATVLTYTARIDRAVNNVTAMDDYAGLLLACRRDGYVPTLRPTYGTKRFRRDVRSIRTALHLDGLPVFPAYGSFPGETK